jgi:hypothetical protein
VALQFASASQSCNRKRDTVGPHPDEAYLNQGIKSR